jgi:hypothetical protein
MLLPAEFAMLLLAEFAMLLPAEFAMLCPQSSQCFARRVRNALPAEFAMPSPAPVRDACVFMALCLALLFTANRKTRTEN